MPLRHDMRRGALMMLALITGWLFLGATARIIAIDARGPAPWATRHWAQKKSRSCARRSRAASA